MKKLALGALLAGLVACGSDDGKDPIVLPDSGSGSGTVDAPTSLACDPLTQTGCSAGEKCGWVILQEEPFVGSIECVADGTVAVGGTCAFGAAGAAGFSNCVKGSECVSTVCKSICDHNGGDPMCSDQYACSNYNNLFEAQDMTIAGVCDVKCDPLTQEAVVATPTTAACGSTDNPNTDPVEGPANPNVGCYTNDFVDFTCARIPAMAKGKVDYMEAYGPAAGSAFVNGCEAGFVPAFSAESGSMVVVCSGLCAPKKTDIAAQGGLDGDATVLGKLPTKAAPAAGDATCAVGRKGSETISECRYAWWFNVSNGMVPETPYNETLGLCFKPSKYNFDHDGNAGTVNVAFPSCKDLPATTRNAAGAITPPANCTCDANESCTGMGCPLGLAHEWGCYSLNDTLPPMPLARETARKVNVKPFDVRAGHGQGKAFRHVLQ